MLVESKNKIEKSQSNYSTFSIFNKNLKLILSPYGASIHKLFFRTGSDTFKNIAFSLPNDKIFYPNSLYAGATLAPTSGRIKDGILTINNTVFQLTKNENNQTHLHGGTHNLSFQNWAVTDRTDVSISFSAFLKDKTDGYPGNRNFYVSYELKDSSVEIHMWADSDKETYFNMSNHTYFNLNAFSSSGLDQFLRINADSVIYNNEFHIPKEIKSVKNSAFDFKTLQYIAKGLYTYPHDKQLLYAKGYNHYFILSDHSSTQKNCCSKVDIPACTLLSGDQQLQMDLYTDAPALVLYSGGFIDSSFSYQKEDNSTAAAYPGCGIAVEPSYLPFHHICPHASTHFERKICLTFTKKPKTPEN